MFRPIGLSLIVAALATAVASAEDGYGDLAGQFLFDGPFSNPALLHAKGAAVVKDGAVCAAADLYAEDLVVDRETMGIANVFVYLTSNDAKQIKLPASLKESKVKEVDFVQKGCAFVPHCLSIRTDQTVVSKSLDAVAHNVHSFTVKNELRSFLVPPTDAKNGVRFTFERAESVPMPVKCDIHGWMIAH